MPGMPWTKIPIKPQKLENHHMCGGALEECPTASFPVMSVTWRGSLPIFIEKVKQG